jgi:GntR family transcriptional regulator/MocR family aminotransferase
VRGVVVTPDRIALCAGFSHGMALLARALHELDVHEIAFENPGLGSLRRIASAAGHRVVGIRVDEQGVRTTGLTSRAVVVTPAHQFPTGATLAPHRRAELVGWAGASGAILIEDDYDGEFRFDRQQVGALQALAPERIVYTGTVSKTLTPALRIGWLVLPGALLAPIRTAMVETGWHQPVVDQLVLAELVESGGYDRHVRHCRGVYRDRRDRLLDALPDYVTPGGIAAGLHILLTLPESGPSERAVRAAARRNSVALGLLGDYWSAPGPRPQGVVIGYATPAEHAFGATVDALVRTLRDAAGAAQGD